MTGDSMSEELQKIAAEPCHCVRCADCGGTGNSGCNDLDELETCDNCRGTGIIETCVMCQLPEEMDHDSI